MIAYHVVKITHIANIIFVRINVFSIYVDILSGGNLSSILLASMHLMYWIVRSSSRRYRYFRQQRGSLDQIP